MARKRKSPKKSKRARKRERARDYKEARKRELSYHIHFESTDLGWLAEEFQRQAALNPDLAIEAFAACHGIQPEWITRFIDTGERIVKLWHGTTEDRARAIME